MVLIYILRFLRGYVKISVTGDFAERFLNLCATHGIEIWNTRYARKRIECCMMRSDYKHAAKLRRASQARIRIVKKYGLPCFLFHYRKRSGLLAGAAVFCAVMVVMPCFVWDVKIAGNKSISDEEIMSAVQDIGIKRGTPLASIDAANMRNEIVMKVEGLSWAAVNIVGTQVTVDVQEAKAERTMPDYAYSNCVADRDGKITRIVARQGKATVKVGDQVVKGSLLVTGTVEYSDASTFFCHSDAEVYADTEHTTTVSVPIKEKLYLPTGKRITHKVLSFFWLDIPLFIGGVNQPYRLSAYNSRAEINGVKLPVEINAAVYDIAELKEVTHSDGELETIASERLKSAKQTELKDAAVLSEQISTYKYNGKYYMTAKCKCNENIAKTEYFEVNNS